MDWLWTNEVAPFSFALLLMFGLGVIELVGLVLGISTLTHSPDTELDANLHLDGATHGLSGLLNWLHIGRAPLLILLVFFLFGSGFWLKRFITTTAQSICTWLFATWRPCCHS